MDDDRKDTDIDSINDQFESSPKDDDDNDIIFSSDSIDSDRERSMKASRAKMKGNKVLFFKRGKKTTSLRKRKKVFSLIKEKNVLVEKFVSKLTKYRKREPSANNEKSRSTPKVTKITECSRSFHKGKASLISPLPL